MYSHNVGTGHAPSNNTCNCAVDNHIHLTDPVSDFTPEEITDIEALCESALKKIYTGQYQGEFPEEFWTITTGKLNEAVKDEFKNAYKPLQNQLVYQNGVFSAFKAKAQTQTLENLMSASKAATFTDFAAEVQSTLKDYNINHLRAEYNTAKKASRSAKRWAKAVEDSDIFPNIEYTPSTAKEPRDKHKAYYGMVRPIDDPVWATILPPSDWGCQCGWRTTDKPVTKALVTVIPAEPGLDNNPGADGALISPSHPYIKAGKKQAGEILKQNIVELYGIDVNDLTLFKFDAKTNGCIFSIDEGITKEGEFKGNMITANFLKDRGHMVELLKRTEKEGVKSIDSLVDNFPTEFKMCGSATSIDNAIRDAASKAKNLKTDCDVMIHLSKEIGDEAVKKAIGSRLSRTKGVKNVFVIKGDVIWKY